jgi:hypothetical protein
LAWTHLKTALQYGDETGAWATPVTCNTAIGTVKSFVPDFRWALYPVQGVGDGREDQSYLKTRFDCKANLNWEVHDFAFLKHAVGPLAGAGTAGSHYTITEADLVGVTAATMILPFTLECGSDGATDDVDTMAGCLIDNFTLDFALYGVLTGSAAIVAKTTTSSTSASAYTSPTTHPWGMNAEATFKWGSSPSTVAGIRSGYIIYKNNLIIYGDWNTVFISMPEAGKREITFGITVVMSSTIATR